MKYQKRRMKTEKNTEKRTFCSQHRRKIANGLLQFEVSEKVRLSIMDKIENYYAPKLKAYYTAL